MCIRTVGKGCRRHTFQLRVVRDDFEGKLKIYAFEPGCAAIFAYFWLGETLAWNGLLGAALLISGMMVSQWSTERPAAALAPE